MLAGISVEYLIRLEQGRAARPSAQVIAALGRAYALGEEDLALLYRAAGLPAPRNPVDRRVPEGARRLANRLDAIPVAVYSADWWLLRWNAAWSALLGDPARLSGYDRNLLWQIFSGRSWRVPPVTDRFKAALMTDLRRVWIEHPDDGEVLRLIEYLRGNSPEFSTRWEGQSAVRHESERKLVDHPEAGRLDLLCDVLEIPGSDAKLVLYTAEPRSEDASRLELLRVLDDAAYTA